MPARRTSRHPLPPGSVIWQSPDAARIADAIAELREDVTDILDRLDALEHPHIADLLDDTTPTPRRAL